MPGYTFSGNLTSNRATVARRLATFWEHVDAMGLTVTAMAVAGGTVTVTINQSLNAEQRAHLGLT